MATKKSTRTGASRKKQERENRNKARVITMLGFLFGLSVGVTSTIGSSYLKEAFGTNNVGIFFVITFILTLALLLNLHKIYAHIGRARTLLFLLTMSMGALFAVSMLPVGPAGAFFLMAFYLLYSTVRVLWDVILEVYSDDASAGRTRGMFLSLMGLGSVGGPIIGMNLLEQFGFQAVYVFILVLYVAMFLITILAFNSIRGHVRSAKAVSLREGIESVAKDSALRKIYWISFTRFAFISVSVVFVPIYLRELGFAWSELGLMFGLMIVPYFFIQYPSGIVADKYLGEKEMLFLGIVLMLLATAGMYIVKTPDFFLWTSILVVSRIGVAFVQVMADSYFYKKVDSSDVATINCFNTARPIGAIFGMSCTALLLLVWPIQVVFLLMGGILAVAFYPIVTMRDSTPETPLSF